MSSNNDVAQNLDDASTVQLFGAAKRYQTILREFMAYTNETGHYPVGHVFTDTELSNITPDEIIRYMKFKLYGDGDVDISDKPLTGSHHTLGKSLDCITS